MNREQHSEAKGPVRSDDPESITIRPVGLVGDLGWLVQAHGELYAAEFGWDFGFETLVARIVADYAGHPDPARQAAWIAELNGRRVGSIACVAEPGEPDTARLRILLVHPDVRGYGLGRRLMDACLNFARDAGYQRIVLWTYSVLPAARKLYLQTGFTLLTESPERSFGADLIGQTYELRFAAAADTAATAAG
jgi:GNAT superfamily N-acetyltransferase